MAKKIIIADDDESILEIFQLIFERAGYDVSAFINANQIFEEHTAPDIYLLDKQLSGVDGLDICKYLKANRLTQHIPVIIVSATPGICQLADEAGANGFIEKPFEISELLAIVEQHLQKVA